MKGKNLAAVDPIITIGRYRIRKSRLEEYWANVANRDEFNLFDNPRSNKLTDTWIKNNHGKIANALRVQKTK